MMISFSGAKKAAQNLVTGAKKARNGVQEATSNATENKGLLGKAKQLIGHVFGTKPSQSNDIGKSTANLARAGDDVNEATQTTRQWYQKKRYIIPAGAALAVGTLAFTQQGKDKKASANQETQTETSQTEKPLATQEQTNVPPQKTNTETPPTNETSSTPPSTSSSSSTTSKPSRQSMPSSDRSTTSTTSTTMPYASQITSSMPYYSSMPVNTSYYADPRMDSSNGGYTYAYSGNTPSVSSVHTSSVPRMASMAPGGNIGSPAAEAPLASQVGQGSGETPPTGQIPPEMMGILKVLLQDPSKLTPPSPDIVTELVKKDPENNDFSALVTKLPQEVQSLLTQAGEMIADPESGRLFMKLTLKGEGNTPGTTILLNNKGDLTVVPQGSDKDPSQIVHQPLAQDGGKALEGLISNLTKQPEKLAKPSPEGQQALMAALGQSPSNAENAVATTPKDAQNSRFSGTSPSMTGDAENLMPPSEGMPTQEETQRLLLAARNPFRNPSMTSQETMSRAMPPQEEVVEGTPETMNSLPEANNLPEEAQAIS
jgi:hypothetical protein